MSNITPPSLEFLSFLCTLYGKVSGNNSEVDIKLLILGLQQSEIGGNQVKPIAQVFFILIPFTFMLENFNPLTNLC